MKITAAARSSMLSKRQVEIFAKYIYEREPRVRIEFLAVKTKGDLVKDRPISKVGGTGVFSKEVNKAILQGVADVGVHSLKDLPSNLPDPLEIVMVPPRGPPNDSLVPRKGLKALPPERLPPGSLIAAGSARRRNMMRYTNNGVEFTFIRGNIDTRLARLDEGKADYLVVAEVALTRLGVNRPRTILPIYKYVPNPGQGIIAVVALRDSEIARLLRKLTHKPTHLEMIAERAFLAEMGGGCGTPVGGYARYTEGVVEFTAAYYDVERAYIVEVADRDPVKAGERAAGVLRRESPL